MEELVKLQRTTMMASYPHVGTKDFYAADDVDALLARIRVAVAAEREAPRGVESCDDPDCGCWDSYNDARAALDALLADGGA